MIRTLIVTQIGLLRLIYRAAPSTTGHPARETQSP
jgi:hypothetical protein